MSYPQLRFSQLSSVQDGENISILGEYHRAAQGHYLQVHDQRLALIGEPFSWIPSQGQAVLAWGELLRGQRPRLLLHDLAQSGTTAPAPELPLPLRTGQPYHFTARVTNIGDWQVAMTSSGASVLLAGEELDERLYLLDGQVMTLDPPTLAFTRAVPIFLPPLGTTTES